MGLFGKKSYVEEVDNVLPHATQSDAAKSSEHTTASVEPAKLSTPNPIKAPKKSNSKYQIMCPYCFNRANGGDGNYIGDDEVAFRAETSYRGIREIESLMGMTEDDIEMMPEGQRKSAKGQFDNYKRFLVGTSRSYQSFWSDYNGSTELGNEQNKAPWELPVIKIADGIKELRRDPSGFVDKAVDIFGKETHRRVCPFCHNPLPKGYGKHPVKYISIIGATHSGKTVYISQLLKGLFDYAGKANLTANFTSSHELDFVEQNKVAFNVPLPDSTTKEKFSQPMFYDITRAEGTKRTTNTIVLYDIAGENCKSASDMERFAKYVMQADGIILLIDPRQLGFVSGVQADSKSLEEVFSTIHGAVADDKDELSTTPLAVCISKSDQCFDILPPVASEQVHAAGTDDYGFPLPQFNATAHNSLLSGNNGLANLIQRTTNSVCSALRSEFINFNFFAVSAIGCEVAPGEDGRDCPKRVPEAIRIEEPILWLFKHFGYIGSNEKTLRPFPVPHAKRYIKSGAFHPKLEILPNEASEYEEDAVRRYPQVKRKRNGPWETMTQEEMAML